MKVTKKTLKAVDDLIEKYSDTSDKIIEDFGIFACPLCIASGNTNSNSVWCKECPNLYFEGELLGCVNRGSKYPKLNYQHKNNYPALKQFWTKFKEAAESGKTSGDSIEFALEHYKDEVI